MTFDKKILIVDDSKEYLQIAMNYIIEESLQYEIFAAQNGVIALEIAKNEKPDIIIMDWEMPEMNGIEATRLLKQIEETHDIPIIMSTGVRLSSSDLKIALEAGASDFIRKPLEKIEFIARINSHLKMSNYIKMIRSQALEIIESEKNRLNSIVESLKSRIEDNNSNLLFHDNFLSKIIKQLEEIKNPNYDESILNIISSINQLKRQFSVINDSHNIPEDIFIKTLLKVHPILTPQEIQLCYMLKKGLSTKEISTLTFREEGSVKVARSRLRKKLELTDESNLTTYLQRF